MNTGRSIVLCGASALLVGGGIWLAAHGHAQAVSVSDRENSVRRQNVELTIYNDDFALVREVRSETLAQGTNLIALPEVSTKLDPHSVSLDWQGGAGAPEVTSQSYDTGVSSQDDLLKRFIGHQVELVRYGENGHEAERQNAKLMFEGNGSEVLQANGKLLVNPPGNIEAPANADVVTIPQLSVQAESPTAQTSNLGIAYLSRGLKWSADYVATLPTNPSQSTVTLECWATVENHSGLNYPNAKVSLVAGSPNRAVADEEAAHAPTDLYEAVGASGGRMEVRYATAKREAAPPTQLGEYHAYPIIHPTTVTQERMNRLLMFSSQTVRVMHDYSANMPVISQWEGYWEPDTSNPSQHGTVSDSITFFNTEANHLGEPLPHGAIRVYEPDASGTTQYVGAAQVQDTPKDQRIDLTFGNAFDLTTDWKETKSQKIERHTVRKTFELTVHNGKTSAVDVRIVQQVQGRFTISHEDVKHTSLNSSEVQWKVPSKAGDTVFHFVLDLKI